MPRASAACSGLKRTWLASATWKRPSLPCEVSPADEEAPEAAQPQQREQGAQERHAAQATARIEPT